MKDSTVASRGSNQAIAGTVVEFRHELSVPLHSEYDFPLDYRRRLDKLTCGSHKRRFK